MIIKSFQKIDSLISGPGQVYYVVIDYDDYELEFYLQWNECETGGVFDENKALTVLGTTYLDSLEEQKQRFKAAYKWSVDGLERIEGLSDQQIQNNFGDIIRGMATIQKKTLKALKKMIIGS